MNKPKFNKDKCAKCKYRGEGAGYATTSKKRLVHCYYSKQGVGSCLKPISSTETIDIRGEDYNNCKLFQEGNPVRESRFIV